MVVLECISRLMISLCFGLRRHCFFFVLAVSILLPSIASAEDYTWTGQYYDTVTASSPDSVCSQLPFASKGYIHGAQYDHAERVNNFTYYCVVIDDTGYTFNQAATVSRSGDTCPSGTELNNSTGICEASNKCSALANTQVPSFRFKSSTDEPSGTISKNGCAIELGTGICVVRTVGYFDCTFSGKITGAQLAISDGYSTSDCTGTACTDGVPEPTNNSTPCTLLGSGGTKSCTSTSDSDNPGTLKCGTANGSWVCTESPKSTSTAEANKITQTTTTSTDGGTTVVTSTNTTTTSCKGVGNCSTGTTNTSTTSGTNADGTSKGNTTTCTGSTCNGASVSPPDDADDEDDDQDDSSVSGDMACSAVVACSGDVIQCAILRQTQQSRCEDSKFRDMSDDKTSKAIADVKSMSDEQGKLTADADHSFDFSNVIDTSSRFTSSCPRIEPVAVPWVTGGSINVDPNIDGLCTYLTYMGYIMVALTMLRAISIVLRT